ncbi:MAG: BspA family leucine-rich repeat surface protein [Ruminococcus sp.]|nr:BspA family leucine-rich repeat surface protein [Ruminococcus sp.]
MFASCSSLKSVDLSSFDTANVITMYGMFEYCSSLESLDLSNFKTTSGIGMGYMLKGCTSLYILDISGMTKFSGNEMLEGCDNLYMLTFDQNLNRSYSHTLTDIQNTPIDHEDFNDLRGWMKSDDPTCTNVTGESDYAAFPAVTEKTTFLRRSMWTWSTDSFIVNRFSQHMYLHGNVNLDDITGLTDAQKQWVRYISAEDGMVFPENCSYMFQDFIILEDVKLNNVDTSNVTSLGNLFRGCKRLKNVEISNWNTSKVKNLQYLFYNCERLESAEMIQNWDTSSVTHTANMFSGCTNLKTFDGSKWKTNNLQSASSMFAKCTSLREVNITNWNTDNLVYANLMFNGCSSLTYLELGPDGSAGSSAPDAWRTPKVTSCFNMFQDCSSLESLRINNFSLGENVRSDQMFSGLDSLVILYFGKTFEVTENMNLPNEYGWTAVGKNGFKVSGDGEYAVIPKPARYEQFISMKGYKFFNVALPGVNNNYYYETIYLAGKPYPGNTVDNTIGSEGVHHSNYNYSIDEENTGWYDVDNGRFLENGEKFRFGGAYVFKIRYVPKANVSLTLPTADELSKINFYCSRPRPGTSGFITDNFQVIEPISANKNADGSLDVYAGLSNKVYRYNSYFVELTSNVNSALMDVPEGSVVMTERNKGDNKVEIYRLPSLEISTWSDSISTAADAIWENYIKVELPSFINDDYAYFMDGIKADSYAFSFDGGEYTKYTNGYNVYTDLLPSTKHTLSIRLEGQEEPFYSEDIWTEIDDRMPAVINTVSVTFGGTLGLNYYITLGDNIKNDPGAYAEYTIGGVTKRQLVSDTTVDSKGRSKFTCSVYAKQMNDNINFKLYNGNGVPYYIMSSKGADLTESGFDYSVSKYMSGIASSSTNSKMVKLANATLDYGAATRLYFNYNTDGATVSSDVTSVAASIFDQYKATQSGTKPTGISGVTMTVVFEADNSFRLYYKYDPSADPNSYTYYIDGKKASLQKNATGYYLEVANIAAKNLMEVHTFTVKDSSVSYNVNASVLTYARSLSKDSDNNKKNLAKALYLYNQAAISYFN